MGESCKHQDHVFYSFGAKDLLPEKSQKFAIHKVTIQKPCLHYFSAGSQQANIYYHNPELSLGFTNKV